MKKMLAAALLVLALVSFIAPGRAAPPAPVTTNKIEGPVTGHLNDAIDLWRWFGGELVSNMQTVRIRFCMNRELSFGNLMSTCSVPDRKLHIAGQRQTTGIAMTPEVEGEWRWDSDYVLRFEPDKPWPPGRTVHVVLQPSVFPSQVNLHDSGFDIIARPLRASIGEMRFFQDPNETDKRGISTSIRFNSPVTEGEVKSHLSFKLEELSAAEKPEDRKIVSAGDALPFEVKVSEDGLEASVTTPLATLPDKERFLGAAISMGLTAVAGGEPLGEPDMSNVNDPERRAQRVRVPSIYDYAKIDRITASIIKNERLMPEQTLVVSGNAPFEGGELERHLKVYLLPKDKPPVVKDGKPDRDYRWTSATEVTDDILAKSEDVHFIVDSKDAATMHGVKVDAEPKRWLYARVTKGLNFKGGYILADDHNDTAAAPEYSKEVKILSDGALLSLSGEKKISLYSLGAEKIEFEAARVLNDDISHLVTQTNGSFQNPGFHNAYSFNQQNISEKFTKELPLLDGDLRRPQFSAFDFTPYLKMNSGEKGALPPKGKGLFFLSIKAMAKDKDGKDRQVAEDHRFVLVSDLGLVVKTAADGGSDVFVQSVAEGTAVPGAHVEVLGVNGVPIATVKTDAQGHVTVPPLKGMIAEKRPVAWIARAGEDLAFMPFERRDRGVDYSKFDTDGLQAPADGLRAFLFSDRGVYRPGEQVHLGMIVKQGDWAKDLTGLPLRLEISNPRGRVIENPLITLQAGGAAEYSFSTRDTSPTGPYSARLYIVHDGKPDAELGSTAVRVEEFIPDTLKITSRFNKPLPKGWVTPEGLGADVTLMHLYGAPAADHRVAASVTVTPGSFVFKDYPGYAFFDALKSDKSYDQPVGEAQTDAQGHAAFDLKLAQFGRSTYKLVFTGEGFAQDSGRSVLTTNEVLVSALPYVVGMKPEGNLGYINKGEKRAISLIAVDPDLRQTAARGLKTEISKVTYISSLIKNEQGKYEYRSVAKQAHVASGTVDIPADGLDYKIDSAAPGSYELALSNGDGLVLHRIAYSIVGEGNMIGHARKDAAITVRLDHDKYAAGGTIKMNISSPYTGAGLITLETDKVLAFKWFRSKTTDTVQTIEIPKAFTGKGFVNVQFVRALDSKEVYTAPFAYAVQPFRVDTSSIDSHIKLDVPEKIKPGDDLAIGYSTKAPGKIIVYAVDEGILQYAHYKTPDPLDFFVGRRALQVATAQILDLLMPEYALLRAATGGDGEMPEGRGVNPFKRKTEAPVAFWSGIVDAGKETRTLHYKVPDYFNGNMRVMAVAVSDAAMGANETKADVRGDLIISPNVPVFAAPGDTFRVGLSLANNVKDSGKTAKVKLTVTPDEHLEVTEGGESELAVPENGEVKADVRVKAKDVLGGAKLTFTATYGEVKTTYEATLSVRPPVPSMTSLVSGYVEKGDKTVQQGRSLYKEFASADASVSTLPVSLIPGLGEYLDKFPYGCTEQTVSRAFPAVTLSGQKDLGGDAATVQRSVENTMSRLRELQNDRGGFGMWWYGGEANGFVSVYALHYMTLAREKHLPVPDETFREAQNYVRDDVVNKTPTSLDEARVQAYGIYVLTRGGMLTSNYLPHLLQYLDTQQKGVWKSDLAAVYIAGAYKMMQLKPEADALMNDFALGEPVYWKSHAFYFSDQPFYNSLNRYAQYLAVVSDQFPEMLPKVDREILFRVANFIGEGSYNTLSSSYAIMAFSAYGNASSANLGANLTISQAGKTLPLTGELIRRAQLAVDKGDVAFGGGGDYGLFYQIATDGYDRLEAKAPVEDGLEIKREFFDKKHEAVKEAALGDTLDVVITMRAHDNKTLSSMALVDLLPGGFEMVTGSTAKPAPAPAPTEEEGEEEQPRFHSKHHARHHEAPAAQDDWLKGAPWHTDAVDAREDRLIAFGSVPPDEAVYHYQIKAVNAGTFTVPPAYIESMYDRAVKARGVTSEITVK